MSLPLSYLIFILYSIAIVLVFLYGLAQTNLLINYLKSKKTSRTSSTFNFDDPAEIPFVTIQLPLYNEKYVVDRLLQNIVKLHYPKDKLQIQVLDDSTDDSLPTTKMLVAALQKQGFDINLTHRTHRIGFKAGALKEGLTTAKGEFIAIFDADFVPKSDWLYQTVPHFKAENVGVVQTRWAHINRNYSLLTKIQAFALDAHFTLEQVGRNAKNHCINFNGTAGIWRKKCILDAGNWEADTLTEDLDLSYRAQLKNWKFVYLEHVETPSELPAILSAARSQQFRWNKGGAENLIKLFKKIVTTNALSKKSKFHALLHLLNSSMFLCVFIISVLSVPMLIIKHKYEIFSVYFNIMAFFIVTTILFFICYWVTYKNIHGGGFKNFMKYSGLFFTFYAIAMGFSFQNSVAVLEAYIGKKSAFIRTPKLNIEVLKEHWKENVYLTKNISKNTIFEFLLIAYFIFGLYMGFKLNDYGLVPFHLMLVLGYGYVVTNTIKNT